MDRGVNVLNKYSNVSFENGRRIYLHLKHQFVCLFKMIYILWLICHRETSMLRQQKSALVEISKFVIWYVRYTIPTVFVGQ